MLVDWFTVAAQVVNFLILVALLKRFLYRPIIEAMDAREARIAARLAEAEKNRKAAETEHAAVLQERRDLEDRRQELLAQAEKEVEAHKQDLIGKLHREIEDLRARWNAALARERDLFFQDLRRRLVAQVAAVSRRAFRDLAGLDLEQRLLEVFLQRLTNLEAAARIEFVDAAKEAGGNVLITTAFEMPAAMQTRITQALQELAGETLTPRFESNPEAASGIEVKAGGCKIAWSLDNFLQGLEEALAAAFAESDGRRLA
ncbi:MAG: F0F1 ATP synthase subunit B [Deltaproteobacteria bacterium]|nr:MAG: F0F1 ATP synthase subunit B [Deltaproteobacteria bacterium]